MTRRRFGVALLIGALFTFLLAPLSWLLCAAGFAFFWRVPGSRRPAGIGAAFLITCILVGVAAGPASLNLFGVHLGDSGGFVADGPVQRGLTMIALFASWIAVAAFGITHPGTRRFALLGSAISAVFATAALGLVMLRPSPGELPAMWLVSLEIPVALGAVLVGIGIARLWRDPADGRPTSAIV